MNEQKKAPKIRYSDIHVGAVHSFERIISREDVMAFAEVTGDFNPLHTDKVFGEKSRFKGNIIHGMLAGSLFSALVGMHCPGENSLYLTQTLQFKNPVFPGDKVIVKGTVTHKNDCIKMITMNCEILVGGKVAVTGEAKVGVSEND